MKVVPVAGLLAGLLVAADSRQERVKPPKTDQEAIQGTWKVVDATLSGKKLEGTDLGEYGVLHLDKVNIVFVVEGNKWQFKALDKTQSQGTFKLDPEKKPKAIDVAGAGDKKTILGIYSLEKDKLTLCFPDRGNERRSSEFSSTKDNKCALLVLERRK